MFDMLSMPPATTISYTDDDGSSNSSNNDDDESDMLVAIELHGTRGTRWCRSDKPKDTRDGDVRDGRA